MPPPTAFVAVMPEGVEHPAATMSAGFTTHAFVAVMPEGVEHPEPDDDLPPYDKRSSP